MSELVGQALGRYRLVAGQVEAMHIWCKTLPDGTAVLGGAPFNVARHLQAFGLGLDPTDGLRTRHAA